MGEDDGRMIYVMSDIHGNSRRFNSIMKQINLQPEDTLYILGDVIDRYPDGIKILRQSTGPEFLILHLMESVAAHVHAVSAQLQVFNELLGAINKSRLWGAIVKKDIADFIKELADAGIKTKKRKVDLSPENL